jgi:hypothetical protein
MEEHPPQPWTKRELSLPDPAENLEQAMPARDMDSELDQENSQAVSENVFAEKAVQDTLKMNPEAAYNHTVAAAEREDPIEKDRELRHEIKFKQPDASQGAVPVGQVIADAADSQPKTQPVSPPPVEPPLPASIAQATDQPAAISQPKQSLYWRATMAGFLTGLFIILAYIFYRLVG